MLPENTIKSTRPKYASSNVFIFEKNETFWFCIHYRKLNAATERDSYLIQRMDDFIGLHKNATIASMTDANR